MLWICQVHQPVSLGGKNKNKKPKPNTSFQRHSKMMMSEEALLSLRGFGSGHQCVVCSAFSNLLNSKTDAGERWEAQAVLREMNMPLCNSGSMKLQIFFLQHSKISSLIDFHFSCCVSKLQNRSHSVTSVSGSSQISRCTVFLLLGEHGSPSGRTLS